MIRIAGTVLLAIGFLMLAGTVLIRDPAALDANIGAGILSLIGLPAGALGLVLVVVDAVVSVSRRHRSATSAQ